MDLLNETKNFCRKYNIKPSRKRGQNFLINEGVYDSVMAAAKLNKDDVVLEVGPGLGFLTERLARAVKRVVAVELDDKLCKALEKRMQDQKFTNVDIINDNILDTPGPGSGYPEPGPNSERYKIVANLPYQITSIFLRKFLSGVNKPESMTLMLQKEVAERIVAKPLLRRRSGQAQMSLLAVSVQYYAHAEIVDYVGKENFWPEPKVDSAIIHLTPQPPLLDRRGGEEKRFWQLVKFGYSARRKMLKNNLAAGFRIEQGEAVEILKKAGFNEKIRAQELSVEDWIKVLNEFG